MNTAGPTVVAIVQQKGGVGKTTLAASLFAHAVSGGDSKRIADPNSIGIIDLDPQGNLTAWALGMKAFREIPQHCGAEAFTMPDGAMVAGDSKRIPAGAEAPQHVYTCTTLGRGLVAPANQFMATHRFTDVVLHALPFRTVIVDTPPHLPTTLFRSIIRQATVVVAPVQPERFALQGVPDLLQEIMHGGGAELLERNALRLVVTMQQRCTSHATWEAVLREHWPRYVSPVVIPRAAAWQDVANALRPWNPKSVPGKTAAALWNDIQKSLQRRAAA